MSTKWKVVIGVIVAAVVVGGIGLFRLGRVIYRNSSDGRASTFSSATPTSTLLAREMTATPVPSSPVTITVTAEQVAVLMQEGAESNSPVLTMRDPVVQITDEYVALTGKVSRPGFGALDLYLVCVPVVEDGELHFQVTAATIEGRSAPRNIILEAQNGLDQLLSQSLSGGYEIEEVILSDGLITLVRFQ